MNEVITISRFDLGLNLFICTLIGIAIGMLIAESIFRSKK